MIVAGNLSKCSQVKGFSLQQITIEAEVHHGKAEEEETKVNFLISFIESPTILASWHHAIMAISRVNFVISLRQQSMASWQATVLNDRHFSKAIVFPF